jgi:TonB family protein
MKYFISVYILFLVLFASAQKPIFVEKKLTDLGLFLVKTEDGKMGVVDMNDNYIIPLDSGVLRQWFSPGSKYFIRGNRDQGLVFQQNLYDSTGQMLFSKVNISNVGFGTHMSRTDDSFKDFFMLERKGMPNKLLFHKSKGQILPDSFSSIDYGGRNSTFLALHLRKKDAANVISVYNLQGNKLFTVPSEISVMHSGNPNILLATKFNPHKMGLVFIDKGIDSTVFEFDALRKMWTGWFVFSKDSGNHYGLLDPNAQPSGQANFTKLGEPNRAQTNMFLAKIGSSPIATGLRAGMVSPAWIGIDSLGNEYLFTEAVPSETKVQMEVDNKNKALPEIPAGKTLEKAPEFPGGQSAMNQFLIENLIYPNIAKENGTEGTVILKIIVEADGQLSDIFILRDINNGCGQAAIQSFKKMPRWSPAVHHGKAVRSSMVVPVRFKLTQ